MHILAYLSAFPRQVFTSLLIRPLLRNLVTPLRVNYHATLKWGFCFPTFLLRASISGCYLLQLHCTVEIWQDPWMTQIHSQDSYMHICVHILITLLSTALNTDSKVGRVVRSKENLGISCGAGRSNGWMEGRWEWEVEPLLGPEWRVNVRIWASWDKLGDTERTGAVVFLIVPLVFISELWLLL